LKSTLHQGMFPGKVQGSSSVASQTQIQNLLWASSVSPLNITDKKALGRLKTKNEGSIDNCCEVVS